MNPSVRNEILQMLADGKITAARAAKLEARLPKLAERIVNLHKGDRQGG